MAKDHITTIDIGTNSVKVLEMELTQSGFTIVNSGVESYMRQSAAEKVNDEAVTDALIRLVQSKGIRTKPVAISVPRHIVTVKVLTDLPTTASEEDIEKMVPIQVEPELPFAIADTIYSYYNIQRSPEGISLEVVATKRASIERYTSIAENLGLKLEAIIPSSFATYAVVFDQLKEQLSGQSLAVANVGAGMTDFCIIQNGRLAFSRSFAFGGNNLTQAFEKEYGIPFQDAEERKLAEADLHSADANSLTHQWSENLALQIIRSFRAFTGQEANADIRTLWLCGGSALLPGLADYLADRLEMQVNLWNPLQGTEDESLPDSLQMGLSVALGLGIIGIDGENRVPTVNANLLPKEIRDRAELTRRKIKIFALGALAALIIIGASMGILGWRRSRAARYRNLADKLAKVERREEVDRAKTALENSILMQSVMTPYVTPLEVLREMSDKLPDRRRIALTSFSIDKKGKMTISVEANSHADVSEVIQILTEAELEDKVKLFDDVKHGTISRVTRDKRPILQVQIACALNANAMQEIK